MDEITKGIRGLSKALETEMYYGSSHIHRQYFLSFLAKLGIKSARNETLQGYAGIGKILRGLSFEDDTIKLWKDKLSGNK